MLSQCRKNNLHGEEQCKGSLKGRTKNQWAEVVLAAEDRIAWRQRSHSPSKLFAVINNDVMLLL